VFPEKDRSAGDKVIAREMQVASVVVRRETANGAHPPRFTIHRQTPKRSEQESVTSFSFSKELLETSASESQWSDWLLWDSRYWIRVSHHRGQSSGLGVGFLTPDRLALAREGLDSAQRKKLDRSLKAASHHKAQWTLPIIISRRNGGGQVVALPTLRWQNPTLEGSRLSYQISYKEVDLQETEKHQIISDVTIK
jgi:hypothetical protein